MDFRKASLLLVVGLGACAGPEFPRQTPYPFGLDAARREAQERLAAQQGGVTPEQQAELAALAQPRCPNWRAARIPHPIDALFGNPTPSDRLRMGCYNQAGLDAMTARPSDILDPPDAMSPAPAAGLSRGIERHRTTGPAPLPERARVVDGL
jgi:hypothetical protein